MNYGRLVITCLIYAIGLSYGADGASGDDPWSQAIIVGDFERAVAVCDSVLQHGHRDPVSSFQASFTYRRVRRHIEADHIYWSAFGSAEMSKTVVAWADSLEQSWPDNPVTILVAGRAHLGAGDIDEAELLANRLINISEGPEALYFMANVHLYKSNFGEARTFCHRTLEADSSLSQVYIALGVCCEALGEYENAEREYDNAVAADSLNAGGFYNLGRLRYERMDDMKGLQYIAKALDLYPEYVQANIYMAAINVLNEDWPAAVDAATLAVGIAPQLAIGHLYLGIAEHKLGFIESAVKHYEEVIRLDTEGQNAIVAEQLLKRIE